MLGLTVRLVFALAELVWVVVRVARLRSKFRGQFEYGDGHLSRLQMQQTRFVGHAAKVVRQERRQPRESKLRAPDIGCYFNEARHLCRQQSDSV